MAFLDIFSRDKSISWRVPLTGKPLRLGRMPGLADIVTPPTDNFISKVHATIHLQPDGLLRVVRNGEAHNPIYRIKSGEAPVASDDFTIPVGESFQIGETVFRLCDDDQDGSDTAEENAGPLTSESAYAPDKVREFRFVDANHRMEALADLPQLILSTQHERMLEQSVLDTLLKGIPEADVAAIVRLDPTSPDNDPRVQVLAMKGRESARSGADGHRPSRRLVHNAIRYLTPTHHVWQSGGSGDVAYTVNAGMDWALCVPLPDYIAPDLGLYASGQLRITLPGPGADAARELQYQGDIKFAQLTADIFAALRRTIELTNQQRTISRFLPMPIIAQLGRQSGDLDEFLQARECDITALFCDLRGSCKLAESGAEDLQKLLGRLGDALAVMTDNIVSRWGVIGDFQGDAAMAFWGWPSGERQVERAAESALHIQRRFRDLTHRPGSLQGMECGIGLAFGRGLAGRLGTPDQYKVGAFGPVVNLASRLESLTKQFRVGILIDGAFAAKLSTDLPWCRTRRIGKVQPLGICVPVDVYELLPSEAEAGSLPEALRRRFERAVDAFQAGRWPEATKLLTDVVGDGPADFLRRFMSERGGTAPAGWDGTIVMATK
jgi:adenylate cyclase